MKHLKKYEQQNNIFAVILEGDGWEAFYVNGKLVDQGHSLGEGDGLLRFLQEQSLEYGFGLHDIVEVYATNEDNKIADETGRFPDDFNDLKGDY